ncbi:amidohydrolase [Acidimicrobiia bacterium EGI L10123]|uniref:amidohydrolase family protein n=1 Tax=Salinilacustrithrix flava TaxID=2957203 RepID=UPI003D7C318D|nr:amidohydrolase [Acidimicrobiia bacterium EGI L10123]
MTVKEAVAPLNYRLFDADNHYYEPRDCFTRHIEASFRDAAIRPELLETGEEVLYFGDRRLIFPTVKFDKCEPPGALKDILRSTKYGSFEEARSSENMHPAFQDRGERLKLMDEQGVETTLLLPTVGVAWEQETLHNVPAHYANLRSFNRWVEEDWGFGDDGRILGVPLISLVDLDEAVAETDRLLERGARVIHIRPAPIGGRSIADRYFDPFWSRIAEAGIPIAFHLADSGYTDVSAMWGEEPRPNARSVSALQWGFFFGDRPIMETLASLIYQNLFGRYPELKVMSIENGSAWVPYFLKQLDKGAKMGRYGAWPNGKPADRPSNYFRQHVKLTPYHEDDCVGLVQILGPEMVLLGSDYPHPEGTKSPAEFAHSLAGLGEQEVRLIMRDNLRELLDP